MAPPPSAPIGGPDPRALISCLDQPAVRYLSGSDRETLRAMLPRATRATTSAGDLLVADGRAVARVLTYGSTALYRPDPAAPLEHRVLEVDSGRTVTAVLNRGVRGELHEAWVGLADGGVAGILPGGARHPLWGPSDRIVGDTAGGSPTTLTLAAAVSWDAVDLIPPVAEPGRLPSGAGAALLNVLAALAWDQRRPALRYRGPYPTEQLFWSLTESFRFDRLAPGADPLARFVADAEATFARGLPEVAPVDWTPAPHERRLHAGGLVVQLRDGVERIAWQGRSYHRTECQGLRRREHRVVRAVEAEGGTRHYVASLEALGTVLEDHLLLDERGELLDHRSPAPDETLETPLAPPWREALGALLPLEATPLLTGAIEAVWPETRLGWGPVPGDLVEARGGTLRLSPKLARVYRCAWVDAPASARRALAQQLVREVLGLIGPSIRAAATAWLEAVPAGRQEAELEAAARRNRVTLAAAALAPLGRLLDALAAGAALPE
ncbi:MAG TPA: hypothetical protein VHO73_00215 [Methylomirabilota bacterium]|jgi:hypothetical protein|nr:hypothetical protein [Methylomirabilota bacterium]